MRHEIDVAFARYRQRPSPEALSALLEACRPDVLNMCRRVLRSHPDVEDASQQVLLEIAAHATEAPSATVFRAWLRRLCLVRSYDQRRGATRRRHHERRAPERTVAPFRAGPWDEDAAHELVRALATLSEEERELVTAYYFNRVTLASLAESLGVSKVAVWKRLQRSREKLRKLLPPLVAAAVLSRPDDAFGGALSPAARASIPRLLSVCVAWKSLLGFAAVLLLALGVAAGTSIRRARWSGPVLAAAPYAASASAAEPAAATRDAAPPAQAQASAEAPSEAARALREEARLLYRTAVRQRQGGSSDAETRAALGRALDFMVQANRDPASHAAPYAEWVMILYDVAADENGIALGAHRSSLDALQAGYAEALRRVPESPPSALLLAAIEADLALQRGLAPLLPADERGRMLLADMDRVLHRGARKSMPAEVLRPSIVADWSRALQLDEAQERLLEGAASKFVAELQCLTDAFVFDGPAHDEDEYVKNMIRGRPVQPYDPVRRLEYQIAALRAHASALAMVEDVLTPLQRQRLPAVYRFNYAVSRGAIVIWDQ